MDDTVSVVLAHPHVPRGELIRALQRPMGDGGGTGRTDHSLVYRCVQATESLVHVPTPYGPVLQTVRVPKHDGSELEVEFAHPGAFLWVLLRTSPAFADFCAAELPQNQSDVCVYMDDVRPGNVLRPDAGRTYYAWYYQLLALPAWFRSSEAGWFDLCFVPLSTCDGITGGLSGLTDQLLGAMNFPIVVDTHEAAIRYRFDYLCCLGDAKALQQMFGLKTSASYKPCGRCANIFGRLRLGDAPPAPGAYLQHYTCANMALWDEWTHARFQEARAELTRAFAEGPEQGALMERMLGICFNEGRGLAFGERADLYRVPETLYYDAQHCIWASGGVAQYEINQLILATQRQGLDVPAIQEQSRRHMLTFFYT
jgi:hypothetical protein